MHQNPLGAERKFRLLGLPQSLGFSGPGKGPEKLHFCQFLGAAKAAGLGSTLEAKEGASTCGAPIIFSTNLEPVKGVYYYSSFIDKKEFKDSVRLNLLLQIPKIADVEAGVT